MYRLASLIFIDIEVDRQVAAVIIIPGVGMNEWLTICS